MIRVEKANTEPRLRARPTSLARPRHAGVIKSRQLVIVSTNCKRAKTNLPTVIERLMTRVFFGPSVEGEVVAEFFNI